MPAFLPLEQVPRPLIRRLAQPLPDTSHQFAQAALADVEAAGQLTPVVAVEGVQNLQLALSQAAAVVLGEVDQLATLNRPGNGGGYVVKVIASTEARFIA